MLESKDFYTYACDSIAKSSMVNIVLGVSVQGEPKQIGCKWQVQTLEGTQSKQLIADVVIDTRPLAPSHQESPTLWQSFLGQEIMTDGAVFDRTTVSLMDFDVEGSEEYGGITFSYVLPITQTRALIETTVFGTEPLSANMLTRRQGQTVARLCQGANYDIGRVESGILPMGLPSTNKRHVAPGYVRVGLMSGAVRPATGYAFQRIQRWADRCATSLRQGNGPCGHAPDPFLTRFMDKLFLQVLRAHPQQAPDIFVNLFGRANTASVIRFLSDQATLKDRVSIISALPFGLFLRELATREHPPKISMLTKITNNH